MTGPDAHVVTGLDAHVVVHRPPFRLDVRIRVGPGEVLGVLGPNGSGKTTLLRALAGLVPLTAGRIAIGDLAWDDVDARAFVPPTDRRVGLVFQEYRLFPHLSVLDNVAFAARARGARRGPARREAEGWLDRVGLAGLAARRPAQLSGGQSQRTALARALASSPAMLLLDEPLAALDSRTRLEIRSQLRHHLAGFAGPTVVVTHDPLEALVLADQIMVLEAGQVVQQGPPAQVARRPATEYVARLMGLNLYAGVLADPIAHRVELDGGGVLSAAELEAAVEPPGRGDRVLVAMPPSAISLHPERPGDGSPRNVWPGRVEGLELLTDRIRVQMDGAPPALVDITPAAAAALRLAVGDQVWLSAKATELIAYPDPWGEGIRR